MGNSSELQKTLPTQSPASPTVLTCRLQAEGKQTLNREIKTTEQCRLQEEPHRAVRKQLRGRTGNLNGRRLLGARKTTFAP